MATKKPKYSEKDFANMLAAPCFGEFKKPAQKTVKSNKKTQRKGK